MVPTDCECEQILRPSRLSLDLDLHLDLDLDSQYLKLN